MEDKLSTTKWVWRDHLLYDSTAWHSAVGKAMTTVKWFTVAKSQRMWRWTAEHSRFQDSEILWRTPLFIHLNLKNFQHQNRERMLAVGDTATPTELCQPHTCSLWWEMMMMMMMMSRLHVDRDKRWLRDLCSFQFLYEFTNVPMKLTTPYFITKK